MSLIVNKIIGNITIPIVRFKHQKFISETATSPVNDEFIKELPRAAEEIKDYITKKINSIYNKAEEKLNEKYTKNGNKRYKETDREAKVKSNNEEKSGILFYLNWGYDKKDQKLVNQFPLYERILNTPEYFEQKLYYPNYTKGYGKNREEYNLYKTLGQDLLHSLAYTTDTSQKLKLFDSFLDTKPDNFEDIRLFRNILGQKNLFPEKENMLRNIMFKSSLKQQKVFYNNNERSVYHLGMEALANLKTPQQVKVLENIIDDKNKHRLFTFHISSYLPKMNDKQTKMFSNLIENDDYVKRICHSDQYLLEAFEDFDNDESLMLFKKYMDSTNKLYMPLSPYMAPFDIEWNNMQAMITILNKDKNGQDLSVLNRFLEDKNLCENPKLMSEFGSLLKISRTKEGAKLVNKIFDNEKLCNNSEFLFKFTSVSTLEEKNKLQKMREVFHQYTGQYV